jgi:hypothetical protein
MLRSKARSLLRNVAMFLDSRNLFLPGLIYSPYYDRADRKPGRLLPMVNSSVSKYLGMNPLSPEELRYRTRALTITSKGLEATSEFSLPNIELLIVAAEKDFWLLEAAASLAVLTSKNKIISVSVIVPDQSLNVTPNIRIQNVQVNILPESNFISPAQFRQLRSAFGTDYGWLLQQFLLLRFVEKSHFPGVLTLDADTLLLEKTAWLTQEGKQTLQVSSEFVTGYYEFLRKIGALSSDPSETHVTHHMLMQPKILIRIFEELNLRDSSHLLEKTLVYAAEAKQKKFSLDFEFYAQGLKRFFPSDYVLEKFANRSVMLQRNALIEPQLKKYIHKYKSVSSHSYLYA